MYVQYLLFAQFVYLCAPVLRELYKCLINKTEMKEEKGKWKRHRLNGLSNQ